MANKFKVVDNEFNRANYSDIIGEVFDSPPAYAAVEMIKDIPSMDSIFESQSKWSREEVDESDVVKFIIKSLRSGHEQLPIIQSVKKYFKISESDAQQLFTKAVVKMKSIKPPKDSDIKKASIKTWYKKAQVSDNGYSTIITPDIYFDNSVGNYDATAEPANIPFYIDIDHRSWGIKGILIYVKDTIVIEYLLNVWGDEDDQEFQKTAIVDLSRIPKEESHYDNGAYTITDFSLYIDPKGEVDYSKSSISFSKG